MHKLVDVLITCAVFLKEEAHIVLDDSLQVCVSFVILCEPRVPLKVNQKTVKGFTVYEHLSDGGYHSA